MSANIPATFAEKNMDKIIHKASDRIQNDFGWLRIQASFREDGKTEDKKRFGKLVILDDALMIPGGRGFELHPHQDMEIISWVLSGTDEHNDSKNGITLLRSGDVQLMSAGTGIEHAENNHSLTEAVHMFQIWIEPGRKKIPATYQTKSLRNLTKVNELLTFISPTGENDSMIINQQAYLSIVVLEAGKSLCYTLKGHANGVYVFVVLGHAIVDATELFHRDAIGLRNVDKVEIEARQFSQILFIEVPM
jgi:quercetin 2,3-dioxygenase